MGSCTITIGSMVGANCEFLFAKKFDFELRRGERIQPLYETEHGNCTRGDTIFITII